MTHGLNLKDISKLMIRAIPHPVRLISLRRLRHIVLIAVMGAALIPAFSQTASAYVSISSPPDLNLAAIPGTGGASEGTVVWTVATDAVLGYTLTIQASGTPAMTSGANSIADYAEAVPGTPETWTVAASAAAFGFSAQGASTPTGTWGTPASGAGKYRGFTGSSPIEIANRLLPTGGENTTVYFKAEVGASHFQVSGTYTATITATATATI